MTELTLVKSSTVKAVGYDRTESSLYVEFVRGGTYRYDGVNPELYAELLKAESVGKFLHEKIKGRFKFELVKTGAAPS